MCTTTCEKKEKKCMIFFYIPFEYILLLQFLLFFHAVSFCCYCCNSLALVVVGVVVCARYFLFDFSFVVFVVARVIFVICIPFTYERYVFFRHVNCKYSYFLRVEYFVCSIQLFFHCHHYYYYCIILKFSCLLTKRVWCKNPICNGEMKTIMLNLHSTA